MEYYRMYGHPVIPSHKTVRLTVNQRIKRALVNRNIKLLFVKYIEVPVFSMSTVNVNS